MKAKKIMSIVVALCMMQSFSVTVFATNNTESVIQPRYTPCPDGGKHHMVGRGTGYAYLYDTYLFRGYASQCINCYLAIVSERNPDTASSLGRYVMWDMGSNIAGVGVELHAEDVYTNTSLTDPNDSIVSGMEFYRS